MLTEYTVLFYNNLPNIASRYRGYRAIDLPYAVTPHTFAIPNPSKTSNLSSYFLIFVHYR